MSDSRAVAIARAHLEAWTNHDLDTVRGNLADDVQFFSPAANLAGIDEYMDAPRGLTQFAKQVVPGSLRVIAGEVVSILPASVTFRLHGETGERVVFTFLKQ